MKLSSADLKNYDSIPLLQDLSMYVKPLKPTKSRKTYENGDYFLSYPLSLYQSIAPSYCYYRLS